MGRVHILPHRNMKMQIHKIAQARERENDRTKKIIPKKISYVRVRAGGCFETRGKRWSIENNDFFFLCSWMSLDGRYQFHANVNNVFSFVLFSLQCHWCSAPFWRWLTAWACVCARDRLQLDNKLNSMFFAIHSLILSSFAKFAIHLHTDMSIYSGNQIQNFPLSSTVLGNNNIFHSFFPFFLGFE